MVKMAMEYRSAGYRLKCRFWVVFFCIVFTLCGVIYLGYFCPEKVCALTSGRSSQQRLPVDQQGHQLPHSKANQRRNWSPTQKRPSDKLPPKKAHSELDYVDSGADGDPPPPRTNNLLELLPAEAGEEEGETSIRLPVPYYSAEVNLRRRPPAVEQALVTVDGLRFPVKTVGISYDEVTLNSTYFKFDIQGGDVIVFLHIQKTGGTTFGRHLVNDLDLDKPCECRKRGKTKRKRCKCVRPNSETSYWLFSRFSTGWQCGLHADWTELIGCVDNVLSKEEKKPKKRRYFYITLLRDPVVRFLSEYLHVQRGATWKTARHVCGGREATGEELPPCYEGDTWEDVSLDEFMSCPSNLAINRQTRMLADLTLVGCYNVSALPLRQREALMLASAKENLRRLSYFGLCEYQQSIQYMFEETFHMHFLTTFQQFNETHVTSVFRDVTPSQMRRARELNHLDVQLYEYAKDLMGERFDRLKRFDHDFDSHYHRLARAPAKNFQGGEESDSN